jgi:hypothetical protein
MNITPWVQFLVRNGLSDAGAFETNFFNNQENGYGVQVSSGEWFGYRELKDLSTGSGGIRIVTSRTYLGTRENAYAWDELNGWNHEKGMMGYYISCNNFELSALNANACMAWYNYFVYMTCIAHVLTKKSLPMLCKGVNIGFLEPEERKLYDANGFPTEESVKMIGSLKW